MSLKITITMFYQIYFNNKHDNKISFLRRVTHIYTSTVQIMTIMTINIAFLILIDMFFQF